MAVVSSPHPNPHPRTPFPTPCHLETMPTTQHRCPFLKLHCTFSWEVWDTPKPPFSQKEQVQRRYMGSAHCLPYESSYNFRPCPHAAARVTKEWQPCKYYKTKAQHSLICNACVNRVCKKKKKKCHVSRSVSLVTEANMSLRNLVLLHSFLLHYSRLKVYFALLRKGNDHKKHADMFHGIY